MGLVTGLALASIATGLLIFSAGTATPFLATFASGLVSQGIGDLIKVGFSVASGNSIDLHQHLNEKGTAMAITLVTAGTFQVISTLPGNGFGFIQSGANKVFNAAQNTGQFLGANFAIQVTSLLAGAVLQNSGEAIISQEEIEAEANRAITQVVESNKDLINRIYISDALNKNTLLQKSLYRGVEEVVAKYQGRFHDDKTELGVGVGKNILSELAPAGLGGFVRTVTDVSLGSIKNAGAIRKMTAGIEKTIRNVGAGGLSNSGMMASKLREEFGAAKGDLLFAQVRAQGYGEINYQECGRLGEVKLVDLEDDPVKLQKRLIQSCEHIANLLAHFTDYKAIVNSFADVVAKAKASIQKNDIVAPAANLVASEMANRVAPPIIKLLNDGVKEMMNPEAKGNHKFKNQHETINEQEIAGKSGLNKKPETGKDTSGKGQGQGKSGDAKGSKGTGSQENTQARGETPGWKPVEEPKVLIATDGTKHAGGGIRTDGAGFGVSEGEKVRFTTSTIFTEHNGKKYEVSVKSIEILSADGSTVLRRESIGQGIEIKGGLDSFGITPGQIQEGVFIGKEEAEHTYDRFNFHEKIDLVNNVHDKVFNQWNSREGNPSNWNDAFLKDAFSFGIKLPKEPQGLVRDGAKLWNDKLNEPVDSIDPVAQKVPEQKSQSRLGGGGIGSGLLSIEDTKLMKEFLYEKVFPKAKEIAVKILSNPRFQGSLELADGVAEMFVGAGIAVGAGVSVVGLVGGVLIVVHGAGQATKGIKKIWTNEEVESVTAVAMQQLGVPKDVANTVDDMVVIIATLGGTVVIRKVTEATAEQAIKGAIKESGESIPMAAKTEVCSREFGLGEKLDLKLHSPVDVGDFNKKVDTNVPTIFKKEEVCLKKIDLHTDKVAQTTPVWDMNSIIAKEFENGGSWIMNERTYDRYFVQENYIGRSDGQFMISRSAMDRALLETGGDAAKLEELLGLSNLQGKKLYRIDAKNPLDYNPRLPHKGLSGANEHFVQGGLTKGGIPEIVTDPFPKSQATAIKIN